MSRTSAAVVATVDARRALTRTDLVLCHTPAREPVPEEVRTGLLGAAQCRLFYGPSAVRSVLAEAHWILRCRRRQLKRFCERHRGVHGQYYRDLVSYVKLMRRLGHSTCGTHRRVAHA